MIEVDDVIAIKLEGDDDFSGHVLRHSKKDNFRKMDTAHTFHENVVQYMQFVPRFWFWIEPFLNAFVYRYRQDVKIKKLLMPKSIGALAIHCDPPNNKSPFIYIKKRF